jgi:Holliday junction resolvase RusA-like endonuclease
MFEGPVTASFTFYLRRPKSHYLKNGALRPKAPRRHTTKPDVLKLARAIEDALTGIVYQDDAQIVCEQLEKYYGDPERVVIQIEDVLCRPEH